MLAIADARTLGCFEWWRSPIVGKSSLSLAAETLAQACIHVTWSRTHEPTGPRRQRVPACTARRLPIRVYRDQEGTCRGKSSRLRTAPSPAPDN